MIAALRGHMLERKRFASDRGVATGSAKSTHVLTHIQIAHKKQLQNE